MNGIAHIISPLSASWCGWTMLALLVSGVMSEWFQHGVLGQAYLSLAVRADRAYKESPANFMGQTLVNIFRTGTFAMALCLCFPTEGRYSFAAFGAVCGLIIGVMLVKMICNALLDYTFALSRRFGPVQEHYSNLFSLAAMVLYPVLLVLMRVGTPLVAQWTVGIVAALFVAVWFFRAIRTYLISPIAFVYIILYICTLELLPMALLAYMSEKTIVNL